MKKNNIILLSSLAAIIIILLITVVYFINKVNEKEKEISEVAEMMVFEKEQVENEFQNLATEFDGYTVNIKNDSL